MVSWRDIPSQVIVKQGRKRARVLLSSRFQQAVDRAAMRARKRSEDAYISEWARDRSRIECQDGQQPDLQALADDIARDLEGSYSDERLLALIRNHGMAEPRRRETE